MIVVGATGHQNVPDAALAFVEEGIAQVLGRLASDFTGVSSLAAGADQLFAKIVLRMHGRLNVIVPCAKYDKAFVDDATLSLYRHLLEKADAVETLKYAYPSEEAFLEAGRRIVTLSQILVAVWDGQESRGKGGTADIVRYARERGIKTFVVWPPGTAR